ncbi:isochorismate synthase [Formosa agariphila KMM 3901]|uniref:Isochorismate synthase n=1 Tax=Formosa agariphila (strain DSM 15362 / KCTC 12365 / LMG 23005 / KMM 3901 / M-2Alg 35-1) TaxID=1347342 RepID=T2KKH6_FORAG|nr:chorismate-binding protein [Formosa agariphila]CDF78916.1 isochorismate synthase [Formosa agariphila KMM 3901]
MHHDDFFESLNAQFQDALPFVAYRTPNENQVNAVFQHDDTLYETKDLSESGFVFAPFDDASKMVLMPLAASDLECCDAFEGTASEQVNSELVSTSNQKIAYIETIKKAISAIAQTDLKKVVLSRPDYVTKDNLEVFEVFKRLLATYKTAFVYCWYHPKIGLWLGATPETLLKIEGQRMSTMALAGTQVYKGTTEVSWGTKEAQEQQFVTDYIVSNLDAEVEHVSTSERRTVRAGGLLHLQTQISARLGKDYSGLLHIVRALHPTPAVCGLPKAEAKAFILEHEGYNREYYSGFMGELHFKKRQTRNTNRRNVENNVYATVKTVSNLYVNLRCMQVLPSKIALYVGGGITKDSNPEAEWEETVSKTSTMKKVLF